MSRSNAHPRQQRTNAASFAFGLSRESIVQLGAVRCDGPALPDEQMHYFACGACGQMIDARDLGEIIYHESPNHAPMVTN
jgi:hypothetical protein